MSKLELKADKKKTKGNRKKNDGKKSEVVFNEASNKEKMDTTTITENNVEVPAKTVKMKSCSKEKEGMLKKSFNTLFVSGIPYSVTNEQLETHFQEVGPIKSCFVVLNDTDKKLNKGFGYVKFAIQEDAKTALKSLNNSNLLGKKLKLRFSNFKDTSDAKKMPKPPSFQSSRNNLNQQNVNYSKPILIIRNLPFNIKEDILKSEFNNYGKIVELRLIMKDNKPKGFAFVELETMDQAMNAVKEIFVDFSLPKDKYDDLSAKQQLLEEKASNEGELKMDYENGLMEDIASDIEVDNIEDNTDAEDGGGSVSENAVDPFSSKEEEDDANSRQLEAIKNENTKKLTGNPDATLFIRNLSFDSTETELREKFENFGPVKYARITKDHVTGRSRGTGFICFKSIHHAQDCMEEFKKAVESAELLESTNNDNSKKLQAGRKQNSILVAEPSTTAASTPFVLAGRFLNISQAVSKTQAALISNEKTSIRQKEDRRNLYLMREGVIYPDSPAGMKMAPGEMSKRQASYTLRKKMLAENPNLFISKTRLSIRNLSRSIDDKFLRFLGKHSVKEFWKEVEGNDRSGLEAVVIAEDLKNGKKKPGLERVVQIRQAKVVRDMERVDTKTKLGRSKGYAFIEFESHADALACLRYLNNNPVAISAAKIAFEEHLKKTLVKDEKKNKEEGSNLEKMNLDGKQRPICEFAIENNLILRKRDGRQGSFKKPDKTLKKENKLFEKTEANSETEIKKRKREEDKKEKVDVEKKIKKRKREKDAEKEEKSTKVDGKNKKTNKGKYFNGGKSKKKGNMNKGPRKV
ncbi:RNA recognition motif-containing protein [Clydaea vesicula]|uniref:RNA recognition motif-containing protein n=1 Tax=Clydaea vesicula TaxID=447962 RepID=A0AAD5Y1P6_9FUNG|nr:RNA recognition motif-containing protein [Clydaea vesicula]